MCHRSMHQNEPGSLSGLESGCRLASKASTVWQSMAACMLTDRRCTWRGRMEDANRCRWQSSCQ